MNAKIKLFGGIILVVLGVVALLPRGLNLWLEAWILVKGTVPILVILFGILIIWIESEELKGPPKPSVKKKKK